MALGTSTDGWSLSPDAVYLQAHETRRKWESYIWQWGILLTVLLSVLLNWREPVSGEFSIVHKLVMSTIAAFLFAIYLNVHRARVLMKEVERTISEMHQKAGCQWDIVPRELNRRMTRFESVSSTRCAAMCHLLAFILCAAIAVYVWFG